MHAILFFLLFVRKLWNGVVMQNSLRCTSCNRTEGTSPQLHFCTNSSTNAEGCLTAFCDAKR
eukprot:6467026-Amphidinium_carterae.3